MYISYFNIRFTINIMDSFIINFFKKIDSFYTGVVKKISMKVFEHIPNILFVHKPICNNFIDHVVFKYHNDELDVTDKFKWLYDDNLYYIDLKKLYNKLSTSSVEMTSKYSIEIKTSHKTLIINTIDDKYYIISLGGSYTDDIHFGIIPIYLLE